MSLIHDLSPTSIGLWMLIGVWGLTGATMVAVGMFEDLLAIIRFYFKASPRH